MSKLKVLLVEDNQIACQEFVEVFAKTVDMELIRVTNSSFKGLEYVKDFLPDVVILDLELHEGSGSGLEFFLIYKR